MIHVSEDYKVNQVFLSQVKKEPLLLIASLLFSFTVSGCRIKIAGDDYIVGPLPTYSDQQQGDRRQKTQEPSPTPTKKNEEMEKKNGKKKNDSEN